MVQKKDCTFKNEKISRYNPDILETKDFNAIPVNDIEYIDNYEIWYATFGQGLFLQDLGTIQNFNQNDGLKSGGMIFDMVNWKGKRTLQPKMVYLFFLVEVYQITSKRAGLAFKYHS